MTKRYCMTMVTCVGILIALAGVGVNAQVRDISGAELMEWDQAGVDLSAVQLYGYNVYIDGVLDSTAQHNCSGSTSPFVCDAPFPAMVPGLHTVTLTAFVPFTDPQGNPAILESLFSNPLAVNVIVAPAGPTGLRLR